MKILIDNNVALDALLGRQSFNKAAERILMACVDNHEGYLSVNSLTDIFYVLRKTIGAAESKAAIIKFMDLVEIIPVDEEDCINALSLPIDDFEDALILICAKKEGTDYIVTRDKTLLQTKATISIITPDDFLNNHTV